MLLKELIEALQKLPRELHDQEVLHEIRHMHLERVTALRTFRPSDGSIRLVLVTDTPIYGLGTSSFLEPVRTVAHYPDGMGEESRRLHREYNRLVAAQARGEKNSLEIAHLTDECAVKGIVLVPGGENL